MSTHLAPSTTLLVKLVSLVVHADELLNGEGVATTKAGAFDLHALEQLLRDPDVVEWVRAMSADGLAPVKR